MNPEDLLKIVMNEEEQLNKGRLKIFLGMAAGVGKTYAMLEAAQKLYSDGVDVVVGVIKTHGRQETALLLKGLEIIPEKVIYYKETSFEEFDIDKALLRHPQILLVDELAHSNVPGSRHLKRWQDVVELLDHGISVYTTLNVQHIESIKDIIEKIAGITIRETVPDQMIDRAHTIELIDLTPEELLRRLKEGKVYFGEQSVLAAQNFFQEEKLTALREIVLRYAADKIDHDLKELGAGHPQFDAWQPRERLLVAVSHSPHSQKLIRTARRLAFNLDAPWIAVHVDTRETLDSKDQETLARNLILARELGAEVISIIDDNIGEAIQRVAHQKGVTQMIIGRPPKRLFFDFFLGYRLIDQLARDCSDIDLHIIRQMTPYRTKAHQWPSVRFTSPLSSYLLAISCVLLLSGINWFFLPMIGYRVAGGIFLIGILLLSLFLKKGPIFLASSLYASLWLFAFSPRMKDPATFREDSVLLALYFFTGVCTGILADRVRHHSEILEKRERSIEALYEISQDIAGISDIKKMLISISERLGRLLNGQCEIIIKGKDDLIFDSLSLLRSDKEQSAASWVFHNGKEAGWSTSTLPSCQNLYIPLKGSKGCMGVLAFNSKDNRPLSVEEKSLVYTVCQQVAHHID